MAIMRCKRHTPTGRTKEYIACVMPVGYPDTALICGSTVCEEPALIWLEREEKAAYDRGQRTFRSFTATMKVRAI
jgi:hypothetical protein